MPNQVVGSPFVVLATARDNARRTTAGFGWASLLFAVLAMAHPLVPEAFADGHDTAVAPADSGKAIVRPYAVTETREPCADYHPLKRPFFGDTHVHTGRSQDASTQDNRTTPRDAYAFAQGESLGIQPWTADGKATRTVQLSRPLDFAMVSDHAEQIGEVHICKTPGLPGHDSMVCRIYRNFPRASLFLMNGKYSLIGGRWGFCGEDGKDCLAAAHTIWMDHQAAAEEAYDRSSKCDFTTFVGYEWTAAPESAHLHRNIVFRNERVPHNPISVMETGPEAINLWTGLDRECRDGIPGCAAITIPHNSNLSRGFTFSSATKLRSEITPEEAPIRERYERLVEMMQHKGESECALLPGAPDEDCGFEKSPDTMAVASSLLDGADEGFVEINYVRGALLKGLSVSPNLPANPLRFGFIGSTDTHLGTPGLVEETNFQGHGGAGLPNRDSLPPGLIDVPTLNPGGLAVVWAEENTRDSLFEAMNRRETYATSGTRPMLRFFGGWDYDAETSCGGGDPAVAGYAGGVPMGGDLGAAPEAGRSPRFLVAAARDAHPDAGDLQRIEIIKGWIEDGEERQTVVLASGGENNASVDLATCERKGQGQRELCSVWEDPDFDPAQHAFYYARLKENPSCRWSQWQCIDAGVVCSDPTTITEGFEACCAEEHRPIIQERAWSSPIWYSPAR